MSMTVQIALRISDDLVSAVDRLCEQDPDSPTRSDLLRKAIEIYVEERQRNALERDIIAAYTRLPQSASDLWGSLSDQQDASSAALGGVLDAEDGGW